MPQVTENIGKNTTAEALRTIANDPETSDAARVSALRALADIERRAANGLERISAMTAADIDAELTRVKARIAQLEQEGEG